jgi:hypothetical protein
LAKDFKLSYVKWSLMVCLGCGKNILGVLLDIMVEIDGECALKYIKMKKVDITQAMANCFYK